MSSIDINTTSEFDLGNITRTPAYIGDEGKEILSWYHEPNSETTHTSTIVICPPIAVEYMNSYRTLRYTADYFAAAGIPVLRFDYLGNGSSVEHNNELSYIESFVYSIRKACEYAKKRSGNENIILLGFRIGALFSAIYNKESPIKSMIIWGGVFNGKKYVRELKALQLTGVESEEASEENEIDVAGTLLSKSEAEELSRINLINNNTPYKNILLVNRDDFRKDKKQINHWLENNVNISEIETIDFQDIITDPHNSKVPHTTIKEIVNSTISEISNNTITKPIYKDAKNSVNLSYLETEIIERFVKFGTDNNSFGIITEPLSVNQKLPVIILPNSGANHHAGPNRLYVNIARKLASIGFICLRFDLNSIGDSLSHERLEHDVYPALSENEIIACQQLLCRKYNTEKFILIGLCSGAYTAFNAAQKIKKNNISESILINPLTFHWEEGMTLSDSSVSTYHAWGWYKKAITNKESWIKFFTGKINYQVLITALKDRLIDRYESTFLNLFHSTEDSHNKSSKLPSKINFICNERNIDLTFIFSDTDPGLDILMLNSGRLVKKLINMKKVAIYTIKKSDHTFSKYQPRKKAIEILVSHLSKKYLDQKENI